MLPFREAVDQKGNLLLIVDGNRGNFAFVERVLNALFVRELLPYCD